MLKISDFSRIGRVTPRALRYYDDVGLLKPARVDAFTGYRYYSLEQLPRLNQILALKDLGLSLEQVGHLLEADLPPPQRREMLELKQAELERRILDDQERLARVRARLRQTELQAAPLACAVVLISVAPLSVASVREVAPTIGHMTRRIREVVGALSRHSIRHAGPDFTIFYHGDYREEDLDVEFAVPLEGTQLLDPALNGGARLATRTLPGNDRVASLVHHGGYETLLETYSTMGRWIEANGYRVAGPNREMYLRGPGGGRPVTEIQHPVEARAR
jgi:DNA-binding transcriptional MerR regulator